MKGGFIIFEKIKKYFLGVITSLMLVLTGVYNFNSQNDTLIVNAEEADVMVYVGTPINPTGTLNNVYFNTSLTSDEIISIFDSINFPIVDGVNLYIVFADESGDNGITILKALSNDEYVYTLNVTLNREDYRLIYANEWDNSVSSLLFDNIIGIPMMFNNLIGQENGLLSTLISSTPFEYVPISDTEWKGTPINPLGTYDKVYFNTNLSNDDVNIIISNLTFNDVSSIAPNSNPLYFIYGDSSNGTILCCSYDTYDNAGETIVATGISSFTFTGTGIDYSSVVGIYQGNPLGNPYGWLINNSLFDIDLADGVDNFSGLFDIGQQNDYLSQLVSSTPFYRVLKESNNNNVLDGFVDGIFQDGNNALIGLSTLLASGVNALFGVFWANGSLTILGIALAIGVGVCVIYFLFNLVRNWISRVKG